MDTLPNINPNNELPAPTHDDFAFHDGASSPSSPKGNQNKLIAGLIILFLIIALPAALFLSQSGQDIRQRASQAYPDCTNTASNGGDPLCLNKHLGNPCGLGPDTSCQNTETDGRCFCVQGNPEDHACQAGFECRPGALECANGEFHQGFCAQGGVSGPCCLPANTCAPDYCIIDYGGSACTDPMIIVDNANCSSTGKKCVCGTGSSCTCTAWVPGACGPAGGCPAGTRGQTRTCENNCASESRCVTDATCNPQASATPACSGDGLVHRECQGNACVTVNNPPGVCDNEGNNTCNPGECTQASTPPQASATPIATAQCTNIKAYTLETSANCPVVVATDADCWSLKTAAQLALLPAGTQVYFTTLGQVTNGATITQARIQVTNDPAGAFAPWDQALHGIPGTDTKPKLTTAEATEYFKLYTIPANIAVGTPFKVGAEVYSPSFDSPVNTPWDGSGTGWR